MDKRHLCLLGVVLGTLSFLTGCSGHQVRSESPEDTPAHHYLQGMELLESGRSDDAKARFERAIFCDERYSPAYGGLAIVAAVKVGEQDDEGYRMTESHRAAEGLKRARSLARSDEDRYACAIAAMRVNTLLKEYGWLDRVRDAYFDAVALDRAGLNPLYYTSREAANYFMGIAHLEARDPDLAREQFARVLQSGSTGKWHEKADLSWKRADSTARAMAGTNVGDAAKKIAVSESLSRGDLAALLSDELRLERLFSGPIPVAASDGSLKAEVLPADVTGHRFQAEILTVMKWRIRGLEPVPDGTSGAVLFRPEARVNRGEMALVLEDILIRMNRDEKMASAYLGQDVSPFPDVRPTSPLYNAVMNVTTRGIMGAEVSGEFRPSDPIRGDDALLALMSLRHRIQVY